MKKYYFILLISLISSGVNGQVSFTIFEPASVAGGYEFTSNGDGPNWGLANLNDPADAVTDTVVIADDGTAGINAQGVPHANEACAPLINDVAGKIVLLYRYDGSSDNDCYAGTKVLNAQNAGAVGVILVNRDNSVFGYDGTDDGPSTTIPFAFITKDDGALLRARIEAGEDVVAFIGNKLGLYGDDAGIVSKTTIAPAISATATQTSVDALEFGFDVGTTVYNYGSNTQSNVIITASVTGPAGTWTETSGPHEIEMGDSVTIYPGELEELPYFSFDNYPAGAYTLTYAVDLGTADESDFDNSLTYSFLVSDSLVSFCKLNPLTHKPAMNRVTRSGSSVFSPCMVYSNPNGSRLGAAGLYFAAEPAWNVDFLLEDEEIGIILYKWEDDFADLDDAGFGFSDLNTVAEATYIFGEGEEGQVVYAPFDEPVVFEDNQRYLACLQVWHPDIWVGYNSQIDYTQNVAINRQPLAPIGSDATFFGLGFGEEMVPAMAIRVFNAEELGLTDNKSENSALKIYPNPVADQLTLEIDEADFVASEIRVTDFSGRILRVINVSELNQAIDVSALSAGHYIISFINANGETTQQKFIKL